MGARFYTSVSKLKHEIYERFVEDGVRKERRMPFSPFLFVQTNDESTPFRSLTHLPIQKTVFDNIYAMDEYIKEFKGTKGFKIFGSDNAVVQYISERYPEANIPFDINLIHGCVLDIEVESGFRNERGQIESNEFPSPAEAKYPITAITVYATHLNRSITFGLETFHGEKVGTFDKEKLPDDIKKSLDDIEVEYRGFDDEGDLLRSFVGFFKNEGFDYITGWASETFDIPYTCTRIDSVLGRKWTEQLSPVGIVRKKTFNSAYGEEVTFKITGVSNLDLKDIIDKHGFIELDNKKLNTAAQHFLGEEKLDYSEHKNLTEFFYNDYQNYIAYNIHDVNLVRRIDFKTKFIQLSYILSFLYHCNVEDTIATVQPWQHLTYSFAARMGQFTELKNRVLDKPEYIGAYVKDPKPGKYGWAISVDANALYPHMVQQFNMGVETILPNELAERVLGQMVKELGNIVNRTPVQEELMQKLSRREYIHEIYFEEPYEFQTLKTLGLCMAPNLAFFKTANPSLLRQIFKYLYDTRKVIKKSMLSNEQIYENRKAAGMASVTEKELEDLRDLITYEDKNQHGHKIAANAGYGAIAHEHFVDHFDIRIAEAITTAGQVSTRYIMRRLNEWINNEYGLTGEHVFYGDTDSIYCEFEKVVVHLGIKDKPQEEIVDFLDNLFKNTLEPLFITWAEELAKAYNCPINALFFKREAIASVAIFPAKKRYAMLVLDNEGVRYAKPKLKIVGLESRKSNYPTLTREWMKKAYQLTLEDNKDGLYDFVDACRDDFMQRNYNEYGAAQSINNIEDFMDGNGGYIKGTPAHVKGAINHNNLVINMALKDISLLKSGNKYFILPLRKGAPGKMETIAYDESLPKEFNLDKFIDKETAFEKTFISPLKNFLGAIKWEPTLPTTNSLDDLFS